MVGRTVLHVSSIVDHLPQMMCTRTQYSAVLPQSRPDCSVALHVTPWRHCCKHALLLPLHAFTSPSPPRPTSPMCGCLHAALRMSVCLCMCVEVGVCGGWCVWSLVCTC